MVREKGVLTSRDLALHPSMIRIAMFLSFLYQAVVSLIGQKFSWLKDKGHLEDADMAWLLIHNNPTDVFTISD